MASKLACESLLEARPCEFFLVKRRMVTTCWGNCRTEEPSSLALFSRSSCCAAFKRELQKRAGKSGVQNQFRQLTPLFYSFAD